VTVPGLSNIFHSQRTTVSAVTWRRTVKLWLVECKAIVILKWIAFPIYQCFLQVWSMHQRHHSNKSWFINTSVESRQFTNLDNTHVKYKYNYAGYTPEYKWGGPHCKPEQTLIPVIIIEFAIHFHLSGNHWSCLFKQYISHRHCLNVFDCLHPLKLIHCSKNMPIKVISFKIHWFYNIIFNEDDDESIHFSSQNWLLQTIS
jgi:hypothetical protein